MAEFHHGLAYAKLEQQRYDEAESIFREALRIDPYLTVSWCGLARLQAERGDFDSSCRSARAALEIRPGLPDAYWRLASNLKGNLPEADVHAMESLLANRSLSDDEQALVHFGLAAWYDARELFPEAASHLETANTSQRSARVARGETHDADRYFQFIDRTITVFTRERIARTRDWGDRDPRPVFVVGLPRTGTTLVEQILASHPRVHGAGELQEVQRLFLGLPHLVCQPDADPFEAVAALNPQTAKSAARVYLDKLESLAPQFSRSHRRQDAG